jgi:hypothetical protein
MVRGSRARTRCEGIADDLEDIPALDARQGEARFADPQVKKPVKKASKGK